MPWQIRLAVIDTHPIQYRAPLFRKLAGRDDVELQCLFYYAGGAGGPVFDQGFGRRVQWDIPLLEGYSQAIIRAQADAEFSVREQLSAAFSLWKKLEAFSPEVVLLIGIRPLLFYLFLWGRLARRNIPMIFMGESTLQSRSEPDRSWANRAVWRFILRNFSACLYIGRKNREFLETYGVPPSKLFFAPYAVENDRFQQVHQETLPERSEALARLGLPSQSRGFLFCGKFTHKKRVREILRAYAASGLGQTHHLIMVGSGPLEAELKRMMAEHGLRLVRFLGFVNQSEMPKVYTLADFLILVSDPTETWGLVVNEAMACGLPAIVAESCGSSADLVLPGCTGWLVPLDDQESLVATFRQAASLPEKEYRLMSLTAQGHIAQHTFDAMAAGIMAAARFVSSGQNS